MIIDIVRLPRRLAQFKREASINSEEIITFPISSINRIFGYNTYNDDEFIGIGSVHKVLTGKYTPFRYKFIEPTKYGIAEYFVMTESPIDIRFPIRSKRVYLYCPWVTLTNMQTLQVRKFIIWNGVKDLIRFEVEDSVNDVPIESVLANELRLFASLHGRPDIVKDLENYPDPKNVLISEEKMDGTEAAEQLATLGSNIKAYNELTIGQDPYYWPDASDAFRGIDLPQVWTDTTLVQSCSLLNHFMFGKCSIWDIRHLFGMQYDTHAFQRIFNENPLDPLTELCIDYDQNPDLFAVLKYIEHLSYSEFALNIDQNGLCNVELYNPYDPFIKIPFDTSKHQDILSKIVSSLKNGFKRFEGACIVKSWSEETYITIKYAGKTEKYYFDLVAAALGSRSLIRDYSDGMFS